MHAGCCMLTATHAVRNLARTGSRARAQDVTMQADQRDIVTKYLVRIWPDGADPPPMQQSEMCSQESGHRGQAANDEAEITAIRNWAASMAASEGVSYRFEVQHDPIVAALTGDPPARVTNCIARGIERPGGETGTAR